MEDRRSIAALIIIGIILLLMPTYFRFLYGTRPQQAPADSAVVVTEPGPDLRGVETPEAGAGRIASESEQTGVEEGIEGQTIGTGPTVTIDTPLYRARLNLIGGAFEQWKLKKYFLNGGEQIRLIPENAIGPVIEVPVGDVRIPSTEFEFITASPDSIALEGGDEIEIELVANLGSGRVITRSMKFRGDTYDVTIRDGFEGFEATPMNDAYRLMWLGGLEFTEAEEGRNEEMRYSGFYAYQGGDIHKTKLKKEEVEGQLFGYVDWAALRTKYFTAILIPTDEPSTSARMVGAGGDFGPARMNMAVDRRIPTGTGGSVGTLLYLGPIDYRILRNYDLGLQRMMDFGWSFIRPISKASLLIFTLLYEFIPNYGVVIIIFSFIVKILVFPLTKRFYASMHAMQELAPKMQEIREKYKDDPEKMNRKIMNLYKENKVNPLGGCFPMLLQMPVFYALFIILRTTIELRGAPFVLWIQDLSVMDPYMVLPGLMALTMLVQQRAQMKDPRQRPMAIIMPVMFFFLFRTFPAGLTLYWTLFNILSIFQTEFIHKKPEKATA